MDLSHARVVGTGGSGFLGRRVSPALTAQNELQKNQFQVQGASIKASGRAKAITAEAVARNRANELLEP